MFNNIKWISQESSVIIVFIKLIVCEAVFNIESLHPFYVSILRV